MPLFFIIAIGAGAFTLGATAVDVTSDVSAQRREAAAQAQQVQPQQVQYRTMAECQQAATQQLHAQLPCMQHARAHARRQPDQQRQHLESPARPDQQRHRMPDRE